MVRGVIVPHNRAWETKAHWALVEDVWGRTLLVCMYDELVAKVQAMHPVEVLEDGGERAIAIYASVVAVTDDDSGGDSEGYDLEEEDNACGAGYLRVETTNGGVGVIPARTAEVRDSVLEDDLYCILHDLDDHCTAMVVDDCTEVDDRNKIWASRDTEDGHYPKPLANSVRSVSEQAPANEAKVDSGDSPIGSLVPVFLVPLGLCNVCSACFYLLLRTKQQGFDAPFSPGHFLPLQLLSFL